MPYPIFPAYNYPRRSIRSAHDQEGEDVDVLFKKLPDSILSKILSSLPTKDAVRTSVLSKRWEFRWFSINILHFDDRALYESRGFSKESFCSFVDRVLTHCDMTTPLLKFTLNITHIYGPRITTWISAALRRNVESMAIHYLSHRDYPISMPGSFFRHNCLKELRLTLQIEFQVSFYRFFSNLKILKLSQVTIINELGDRVINHDVDVQLSDGKVIREAFISFSKLESLDFYKCKFIDFKGVIIDAPMLTEFEMGACRYEFTADVPAEGIPSSQGGIFRLMTPNLKKFKYNGSVCVDRFILPTPSPVLEATFGMRIHFMLVKFGTSYIPGMLSQFDQLKTLHLCAEILVSLDITNQMEAIPIMEITMLKVSVDYYIPLKGLSLLNLLHKTPLVNTLVLEMNGASVAAEEYNNAPEVSPCVKNNLRTVKLVYSNVYKWSSKDLLLLKYMVMNSEKLAEIVIKAPETNTRIPRTRLRDMLRSTLPMPNTLDKISMLII